MLDDVYEFNDVLICSFGTEVRYEPLSDSKESNLWSAEDVNEFNDVLICAFGTEVKYEPLSDSKESNLWSAEAVNVFSCVKSVPPPPYEPVFNSICPTLCSNEEVVE